MPTNANVRRERAATPPKRPSSTQPAGEGNAIDSVLDRSGNGLDRSGSGRDRNQKGGHRKANSTGEPMSRHGSVDSLEDSLTTSGKPKVALGHSLLSEARRLIKKKPAPVKKRWEIIRDSLVGPEGTSLLSRLSGRFSDIKEITDDDDKAGGEEGGLLADGGGGYGSLEDGVEIKRRDPKGKSGAAVMGVNGSGSSPTKRKQKKPFLYRAFRQVLLCRYLNFLMLFLPFGVLSNILQWGAGPTFIFNFLGLIPLAAILGDFTEEVAEHLGDTIGGLVNASFGNLMEMVIGVQALSQGEIRVVQASMLGSILSNLLLVTGSCFLVGGIIHKEQRFNPVASVANLSLLFLASLALVIPTPIGHSYKLSQAHILLISRAAAFCLLSMYLQLIVFQLVTHKHLFEGHDDEDEGEGGSEGEEEEEEGKKGSAAEEGRLLSSEPAALPVLNVSTHHPSVAAAAAGSGKSKSGNHHYHTHHHYEDEDEEEEENDAVDLGLWGSMAGLLIVALIVSIFSDMLVSSIDGMSADYGISKTFVGVILLPLVGNATEHMTAVTVAAKNRMELAMGIAVGSSTQIALLVIPSLTLAGWALGQDMTLEFPPIEIITLIMSIIVVQPVLLNAQSNWLLGSLLITAYCFCGFAFFFEQPPLPGQ